MRIDRNFIKSVLFSLSIIFFISVYLYLRRGYFNLYLGNKMFAGVAFVLLGIVLSLGPLARLFKIFDQFLIYRKDIGINVFFFALLHSVISLFFLPTYFPLSRYLSFPLTFIFGLSSTIILTILFLLSFNFLIKHLNKKIWWFIQNWGVRVSGLFIFLHFFIMKTQAWIDWYKIGGGNELIRPFIPPLGLVLNYFGIFVIILRVSEVFSQKIAKIIAEIAIFVLVAVIACTIGWGYGKTPKALPLDWETCIHLPGSKILESFPAQCIGIGNRSVTEPVNYQR